MIDLSFIAHRSSFIVRYVRAPHPPERRISAAPLARDGPGAACAALHLAAADRRPGSAVGPLVAGSRLVSARAESPARLRRRPGRAGDPHRQPQTTAARAPGY